VTDNPRTRALLQHLATRPGHDEVKSDFRQLLVEEFGVELGALDFERRVPEVRGRLDALIGRTVFEAKRNLDQEWDDVVRRMPDYLADREREEGERFVGIASDGQKWVVFERSDNKLIKLKETTLDPDRPEIFLAWLDGAVALKSALPPDPATIRLELGQDSVAFRRANDGLRAIWDRVKGDPAVALKRQLWAQLLKLVYGREVESDALFFQHTFLVIVSKAIALAVLDLRDDNPRHVLSGAAFEAAGIFGAAESDFFDWVVTEPEGEALVRRILTHVRRFRLDQVESDVLKILYESLIDREERHGLGEYYTPDWLAAKIVRHAVERPIEQRVLDPACGSGTFLFHAVRNFIKEAEEAGLEEGLRAAEATNHIAGMDIHPVAVIIARVTYLLALAPVIARRAGSLSIPVYLGDSLQLSTATTMHLKELVIRVPPPPEGTDLKFPEIFCKDIHLFDKLVARMRQGSEQTPRMTERQIEQAFKLEVERHYLRDMTKAETEGVREMVATYVTFEKLRRDGRDSVWTYVARNLSRPLALSFGAGWANVVVGNPPWVAFRHMSADLQKRFRELANGERVYVGGKFATQNDLSALFLVRSAALYLRSGGRIAFVMPLAALTRGQFEKFRMGSFSSARIAWDEAWTMNDGVQPLFPVPSCVVFGRRRATAKALPDKVRAYSGELPMRDASEARADVALKVQEDAPKPAQGRFRGGSPYRKSFRDGATLYPRMLCIIDRAPVGRIGMNPASPRVVSRRYSQEKKPWKDLVSIEANVEIEFIRPVLFGESILPYRVFRPFEGVIPITSEGDVLNSEAAANRGFGGLRAWMQAAEAAWSANAQRESMTLIDRWNYHNELGAQFPIPRLRVVYAKAGTLPAACLVRDEAIIDHMLYWARPRSELEGCYLAAILNSETARARIAAMQARGQWGARHFDKVMFNLPIPPFELSQPLHNERAVTAAEAERIAAAFELPATVRFQRARKLIRDALTEARIAPQIDNLVARLLDEAPVNDDDATDG
jgi:hypothetical protein